MTSEYLRNLDISTRLLIDRGIEFGPGLRAAELHKIENNFGFHFPEDLKHFLQTGLPLGDRFPDWRGSDSKIWERLRWPEEGIFFDIRNHVFWWEDWGIRPQSDEIAIEIARSELRALPPMIPIFGHSYLPSEPQSAENPVFSIHQADVIHRGANLAEYLRWVKHDENDDDLEEQYPTYCEKYRYINFWTDLTRMNYR